MKYHIIIYTTLFFLISCNRNSVDVEPIDKQLNDRFERGIQYYQISNFEDLSDQHLMNQLEVFREGVSLKKENEEYDRFQLFFYKKSFFTNYKKYALEAVEENEFGGIGEYRDNLIAQFIFSKISHNRYKYTRVIYNNDNPDNIYDIKLERNDTIILK
ncbi:hypothetical protein [Flavobacterium hercynium]|uniref:Uncharacterized protein n=1 Tax=Flavobacterium hercynium TaxID=387094 RepID=A0A226HKW5_9FLAO|nr:hypothetical protein [Flavobacterium hercynium]OXA94903.1 hypothetical protein B0A66_04055 [Flavobacterium hercynium]SMP09283.1 hypothetical protein SAMN06265346_102239 [Flavobacterium hercynium]